MRRGKVFSVLTIVSALFIGVISFSPSLKKVNATSTIDLGNISFTLNRGLPVGQTAGFYMNSDVENICPSDPTEWTVKFEAVDSDAVLRNGTPIHGDDLLITKLGDKSYYFGVLDSAGYSMRTEGEEITIQGTWILKSDASYKFTVQPSTFVWKDNKWDQILLDVYDKVTLVDAGYDDLDCVSYEYGSAPSAWNTFAVSEGNTTNSFSFEFEFEAYGDMTSALDIRVGASDAFETGHFYMLKMDNRDGPEGVIVFSEYNNTERQYRSGDIEVNLDSGRHTIEFGSIYLKDDHTKTYNFVKYDGDIKYEEIRAPYNDSRTTKVALYYGGENVFIGSSKPQKENDTELTFNHSNGALGIYLDGPQNDIPTLAWNNKAVRASKNNALKNGQPLYAYDAHAPGCLTKYREDDIDKYYISFSDFGITFVDGDVVTLSDEYHFYFNEKTYVMSIEPISFLFTNSAFTPISNLNSFLYERLEANNDLDFYDDTGVANINTILANAHAQLPFVNNMKALWDLYYVFLTDLNAVPVDPEKAEEILKPARINAINELNNYVDLDAYDEINRDVVQSYLDDAEAQINVASSLTLINEIVIQTKELIDSVDTLQTAVEAEILALTPGYEKHLQEADVFTTTDLNAIGTLTFGDSDENRYHNEGIGLNTATVATKNNNQTGNMIFQFNYRSDDPTSMRYGSQLFIRLRGADSNCYRFDIATDVNGRAGIVIRTLDEYNPDPAKKSPNVGQYDADLMPNTNYKLELGTIDLKDYSRTFLFVKLNGDFVIKTIVDSTIISKPGSSIRITDCGTEDGSEHTIWMSPIEEGCTKNSYSSQFGALTLLSGSTGEELSFTARENDIPLGVVLYPSQTNSFLFNDHEIPTTFPEIGIVKVSEVKYTFVLSNITLSDNATIHVEGAYSVFDSMNVSKMTYNLFSTTFTYHAASDNWTQAAISLQDYKNECKAMLEHYVHLEDYSVESMETITGYINQYKALIDEATTEAQVDAKLAEALHLIELVPTLIVDYRNSAKETLTHYVDPNDYRSEERSQLEAILLEAVTKIDSLNDYESIDRVVVEALESIDELKTAEERDLEDLEVSKRIASNDVAIYVGLLQMHRYSSINIVRIRALAFNALDNIELATTIEEIDTIVANFKEAIKGVRTNDGSTFDGETYIEPVKSSGCGGSVVTTSIILSMTSLIGVMLLIWKRKTFNVSK